MTKKPDIVEVLLARHFGAAFEEKRKLITKIFECVSLSDFEKLKVDFASPAVKDIFNCSSFNDPDTKKLSADRLNQIFDKLKPVRTSAGFF